MSAIVRDRVRRRVPLIQPDLPPYEALQERFRISLESGRVTNFGLLVTEFEARTTEYLGTGTVTTSSGTAGLLLVLLALDLPKGPRVAVPSFTFTATVQAILLAGLRPVFCDVAEDGNLDPADLDRLLREVEDVVAVVAVHLYGLPCRTREIEDVVSGHNPALPVLYDAAHAFGSEVSGRRVGTFGTAEVFSLSATKALSACEGGLVASADPVLLDRIRAMRNYGIVAPYDAHLPGLNGKMSELHAAVGIENLRRLPEVLKHRRERAARYRAVLEDRTRFQPFPCPAHVGHTYKDFTVLTPFEDPSRRAGLIAGLAERGIETRAYFWPACHHQRYFRRYDTRPLPVTERLARRVLTLPFFTNLRDADMDWVVASLRELEEQTP